MTTSKKKTPETADKTDPAGAGMAAAMAAFSPGATTAWFEIMQESMRFMTERLQEDMETQRAMLACRTPQDLMQVQSEFYKKAFAQYTEETQRIMKMMGVAAKASATEVGPKTKRDFDDVPV